MTIMIHGQRYVDFFYFFCSYQTKPMSILESAWSYQFPPVSVNNTRANDENWLSIQPSSGSTYTSDTASTIIIKVDSSNGFMRLNSAYLKYTVTALASGAPAGANNSTNSVLGLASIIDSITVRVGETELRRVDNYGMLLGMLYSSYNPDRVNFLNYTEGYNNTTALQGGSRTVCHALKIPIMLAKQYLPLPIISNGLEIRITLRPSNQLFMNAGSSPTVNGYQISNVSFNYEQKIPSPDYLTRLMSSLERNSRLDIPLMSIVPFTQYCSGGSQNVFNLQVGNVSSVTGLLGTFITDAALTTQATDKANIFSSQGLQSYHFEIGSDRIPKNRDVSYITNGYVDPELLMIGALSAFGNDATGTQVYYQSGANFDANTFRISHTFTNETEVFGTGYSLLAGNGSIRVVTNHSGTIPSTSTRFQAFVFVDAVLTITKDQIVYNERF